MNPRRRPRPSAAPAGKSGEHSLRRPTTAPPQSGERTARVGPRVVVVDSRAEVRHWIRPALAGAHAEIIEASTCAQLDTALTSRPTVHLVITASQLSDGSALQVLARARAAGSKTPFVVHTAFHRNLLRIFVSDADGTVLSSRVVDSDNLAALAERLIEDYRGKLPAE